MKIKSKSKKNINEKIDNPSFKYSSLINGCIPTSNATVAVRGIANNGPIVKYSKQVNKVA